MVQVSWFLRVWRIFFREHWFSIYEDVPWWPIFSRFLVMKFESCLLENFDLVFMKTSKMLSCYECGKLFARKCWFSIHNDQYHNCQCLRVSLLWMWTNFARKYWEAFMMTNTMKIEVFINTVTMLGEVFLCTCYDCGKQLL